MCSSDTSSTPMPASLRRHLMRSTTRVITAIYRHDLPVARRELIIIQGHAHASGAWPLERAALVLRDELMLFAQGVTARPESAMRKLVEAVDTVFLECEATQMRPVTG